MYVEPSPKCAPFSVWMKGKKDLYRGNLRPMKAHTQIIRVVDNASLVLEKGARTCVKFDFSNFGEGRCCIGILLAQVFVHF